MNILFIHEVEYIEKVVYEYQIVPELLSSWGNNVYVIDYPDKWKKKDFFDFGSLKSTRLVNVNKSGKIKGVTLFRPGLIKIPVISRISAFFTYFFLIKRVIEEGKIEKIVLFSVPTNGLQTLFWAKYYKIPVTFRLLDVMHEMVPNKVLSPITYWLEKIVYRSVDEVLALTQKMRQYAIKMGARERTCFFVPTGIDADLFYYQEKDEELLKKFNLSKKDRILLFVGTLFNFSGLDKIVLELPKYLAKMPELKLLIVGGGEQYDKLKGMVKNLNLEDKVLLPGFQDYKLLPKIINLAEICLCPFVINRTTDKIFPTKVYQYLACEKPVIVSRLEGCLETFLDNGGKDNVYYFDSIKEFFELVKKIKVVRVKDTNPSLQDLAKIISKQISRLEV